MTAASVGFVESVYTISEEEGAVVEIIIAKRGPISGSVSLQYFTLDGQAKGS